MASYKSVTTLKNIDHADHIAQQSVEVKGQKGVRRSPLVEDDEFLDHSYEDVQTVHELFLKGIKESNNGPCLGWRSTEDSETYSWLSYEEVWMISQNVASGLLHLGLKKHALVGIYSQNNVEWAVMDRACSGYSLVSVPLYDTLGEQAIKYVINQCELEVILVDNNLKAERLLKYLQNQEITSLKNIIIIEQLDNETKSYAKNGSSNVLTFKELEILGKDNFKDSIPPKPEDLLTICYTSGTTGNPKGVLMTHKMLIAEISSAYKGFMEGYIDVTSKDVHLSYLPLPHVFERVVQLMFFLKGASIGFFRGDVTKLMNDAQVLKPTCFCLVPRLMNKLHDKIMAGVNQSYIKSMLFYLALNRKMSYLSYGMCSNNTMWDWLVFHKVQALMGGRVRICITGAAPITAEVLNFIRCVLGVPVIEAYGQTECTGGLTGTLYGDFTGANVGSVVPGAHIKLVDVEEKGYFSAEDKGEVCVRGPIVTQGYYKNPEKTKETIDEDGWLHTGDVGQWLPNGALKIIDRKKHIFKLSQGEYVAPEKVEQVYVMFPAIAQVFVHGDSLKSGVVGVVVPDEDTFVGWCRSRGVRSDGDFKNLCEDSKVRDLLLKEMNEFGKQKDLKSFELVKHIHICCTPFSVEQDLLTPTLKARRPQLLAHFKSEINKMYEDIN